MGKTLPPGSRDGPPTKATRSSARIRGPSNLSGVPDWGGLVAPTCCWSLTTSSGEATSVSKATAVLFGFEDEFDVLSVERLEPDEVKIVIEMRAVEAACPACGVVTARVKDRPLRRVKDLPASGQQTQLWWRKRRLACVEELCPRRSFTQPSTAVRPRGRVTERLRASVAKAIAVGNRAVLARIHRRVGW